MRSPNVIIAAKFGGDHEADLLLAKLSTEDSFTKQWVFVEHSYTLKGVPSDRVPLVLTAGAGCQRFCRLSMGIESKLMVDLARQVD